MDNISVTQQRVTKFTPDCKLIENANCCCRLGHFATQNSDEQKNAPELPIGRFLKSKSLGGNRVILADYEVLVWQVTVATIFQNLFLELTHRFFLLGADSLR